MRPGDQHRDSSSANASRQLIRNPVDGSVVEPFTAIQIATLQARLNRKLGPEYLSTRPQGGGAGKVSYIEAWKAIELANEVFGFNGWNTSVQRIDVDFCDVAGESGRISMGCSAIVRVSLQDGTFHEDVGYGSIENVRNKGQAFEKCKKEAVTDAMKRAMRNFGSVLGNCLYDKQYLKDISKVRVPPVKFDVDDLHRHRSVQPQVQRTTMPPPPQQQQQQQQQPARSVSAPGQPPDAGDGDNSTIYLAPDEFGDDAFDEWSDGQTRDITMALGGEGAPAPEQPALHTPEPHPPHYHPPGEFMKKHNDAPKDQAAATAAAAGITQEEAKRRHQQKQAEKQAALALAAAAAASSTGGSPGITPGNPPPPFAEPEHPPEDQATLHPMIHQAEPDDYEPGFVTSKSLMVADSPVAKFDGSVSLVGGSSGVNHRVSSPVHRTSRADGIGDGSPLRRMANQVVGTGGGGPPTPFRAPSRLNPAAGGPQTRAKRSSDALAELPNTNARQPPTSNNNNDPVTGKRVRS
ncbi:DNA repair protein rad52 [Savitreella phatthalungensis]